MLYLKKLLIDETKKSLSIEEARKAINEGKNVRAAFTEDRHADKVKTSFGVDNVIDIIEIEGCFIIKTAKEGVFPVLGWDDNPTKLKLLYFMDFTNCERVYELEKAKEAIAMGHDVRARCIQFQTDTIERFLDTDLFETKLGSNYKLI